MRIWKPNKKHLVKAFICLSIFSPIIVLVLIASYFVLDTVYPFPVERLEQLKKRRCSTLILDRRGNLLKVFLGNDDSWTLWKNNLSGCLRMKNAIIAAEDRRFYSHHGVDPLALGRAAAMNLFSCRRTSGASTLTMQLMRMALEHRERTLSNKLIELFRAIQCERRMNKDDILSWYLNFAPFGSNIYGIGAAARIYFEKDPEHLTSEEVALLAGLVQSPSEYLPYRYPDRARARQRIILERMLDNAFIDRNALSAVDSGKLSCKRHVIPVKAPHYSSMLAHKYPGQQVVSTLDPQLQYHASNILAQSVKDAPVGTNGAVVILDNRTGAIRAFAGSAGYDTTGGQINYATRSRSPGSLLKPFIYLYAFERGIASPATMFDDCHRDFDGYAPQNYDREWHGKVTVREALAYSYNVPAVLMLKKIGVRPFADSLERFGLPRILRPDSRYGLSLALGGAEFSLLELVQAYSVIAGLGRSKSLRFIEADPIVEKQSGIDRDAAFLICDILKDKTRLNGRLLWKSESCELPFAWKTGTSNNLNDAWTIAWTPDWTIGVMLTCAGSRRQSSLVGIKHAAPLAADLIRLASNGKPIWYRKPDGVDERIVCTQSGLLPSLSCVSRGTELFQSGFNHTSTCECMKDNPRVKRLCIISPVNNRTYNGAVVFKAESSDKDRLFWFVDGKYRGETCYGDTILFRAKPGKYCITCSESSSGVSRSVSIRIQGTEVPNGDS